ncbi:MAG TPA: hypothetical protein VHK69_09025 [Chitinophagaceae bacterium]|jgi:hypothetical protein|nr:hypothetical protein [Chitinophagaceae bacterium]
MHTPQLHKAGLLCLLLLAGFLAAWEGYWRSQGFTPTFNDDKALWAGKRKEAYITPEKGTVFIGSSRIKFDLDIPTWQALTGEKAVQLSLVGTSPLELLKDLAADERFRGKLVVDITEVLFFSRNPVFHQSAQEALHFYRKSTPSEQVSARIQHVLEGKLAFLEERRFALTALLNEWELPDRPGVFTVPAFPKGFEWTTADRQTYMSDLFLSNPEDLRRQTDIWQKLILGDPTPAPAGQALEEILNEVKAAVDQIRSRGGRVLFVRTPSSGPMAVAEEQKYPRTQYWEALLQHTGAPGLHFRDFPETAGLVCPEWSHLAPADAVHYTRALVQQLQEHRWFTHPHSATQP